MTYLLISYNILFCWPHSMNGSSIFIFIAWQWKRSIRSSWLCIFFVRWAFAVVAVSSVSQDYWACRGCCMWHRYLVLKNCWLPVMREMMLHANAVKQVRPGGIVKRRKNWEKVCNSWAMFTSIQGFVSKEPQCERLENNFARLFGRHLSLLAMRLAAVFVGTS